MNFAFDPIVVAKRVIRPLLGERILGFADYIRYPNRGTDVGGPFNGQPARRALFREMIAKLQPKAVVETGTHLGTTTDFIARTGLPVFTIELDLRRYGFARARFRHRQNITVLHGDSRTGLRKLFGGPLRGFAGSTLLFYLDAHWGDDLPLAEEIDIIFDHCPRAVVMIDDFQVPSDTGYGHDDYGPGKSLTAAYIAPAVAAHRLQTFYPSTLSTEEGGWRRGCIVLSKRAGYGKILGSIVLLRGIDAAKAY